MGRSPAGRGRAYLGSSMPRQADCGLSAPRRSQWCRLAGDFDPLGPAPAEIVAEAEAGGNPSRSGGLF